MLHQHWGRIRFSIENRYNSTEIGGLAYTRSLINIYNIITPTQPPTSRGKVIKLSIRALILEETLLKKGFPLNLMTLTSRGRG
jgi:hypothetical protein